MGLESGTYINSLNASNPLGTDQKSQGDDHIRLVKSTVKNTFPNISGPVNPTQTEMNYLVGVTADLPFPSGTKMLFQQTSAPTGWTKDTTNYNDHALRVVTGTASSGGSVDFSTLHARTATDSHTLTISEMPSHDHGGSTGGSAFSPRNSAYSASLAGGDTLIDSNNHSHSIPAQGGGGGHTHNIDMRVKYVDVIIASKD